MFPRSDLSIFFILTDWLAKSSLSINELCWVCLIFLHLLIKYYFYYIVIGFKLIHHVNRWTVYSLNLLEVNYKKIFIFLIYIYIIIIIIIIIN
jgi:hypothetical protein